MHRRQVLILSRFRLSGEALRSCLSSREPGYTVLLGTCPDPGELPSDFFPDVVVLDCGDCDAECPAIRPEARPNSKLIMVARSPSVQRQVEWLKAGIRGIVDEAESDPDNLRKAIRKVLDGEVWASRALLSRVIARTQPERPGDGATTLTPRELEVARLMREGMTNTAIAARLRISAKTVKGHVTHVLRKLGVENRTQAVAQLIRSRSPHDPRPADRFETKDLE